MPTTTGERSARAIALDAVFGRFRVPGQGLERLVERGRLRLHSRGDECFSLTPARAFFLIDGCVREELPSGAVRVWTAPAMFASWGRRNDIAILSGRSYVLSPRTVVLSIGTKDLLDLAADIPRLSYALTAMVTERLEVMEAVYGVDSRTAKAQVAGLLLYLAEGPSGSVADVRSHVDGPSQLDMADALGLGASTVEKAIAELRNLGALCKPEQRRINRLYEIADIQKLRAAAIV